MKLSKKILAVSGAILVSLSLVGCVGGQQQSSQQQGANAGNTQNTRMVSAQSADLAKQNYKSGARPYETVNNNKSTLSRSWKSDHIVYSNLDHENRASRGNTAWLDKNNLANDSLRTRQVVQPTGWHQKFVNRQPIINRGHEIAYSLSKSISRKGIYNPKAESGDQNNMKNLFTQTAFSNQKVQTIYESKVRQALRQGKKVIFQVQPVFQGRDLMAKGVHMQAISTDGSLDFNVYLFNVQPGVQFNYANGRSTIDRSMRVPTPIGMQNFHDNFEHHFSGYRNEYRRHNHHLLRHAAEGYAAYRFGRHMERRHIMHHYYHKF